MFTLQKIKLNYHTYKKGRIRNIVRIGIISISN